MNKAALLKKIRTLAERGVGGEAENAEKLLAHMMEKYDISEDELDADIRERNDFEYHGKEQKKILRQVVYKVTGGNAYELYYTATGRKVKTQQCGARSRTETRTLLVLSRRSSSEALVFLPRSGRKRPHSQK